LEGGRPETQLSAGKTSSPGFTLEPSSSWAMANAKATRKLACAKEATVVGSFILKVGNV